MNKSYIEEDIFLIGTRKLKSRENKEYYIVDYVRKSIPKSDFINFDDFMEINSKNKSMQKCIGQFNVNLYDKIYLANVR